MKRTGIKATEAELERLKAAASAPVIGGPGMGMPQDPAKLAHEIALEHGLPEIPGFYGCDLATGEFLTADNAPIPEGLADKVQPSARELADRVLGKAVHPAAVDRLFAVWPEAIVEVTHSPATMEPRFTVVSIKRDAEAAKTDGHVTREATCSSLDQFDRRAGIRIAFDRCLREAVRREDHGRVDGRGRTL